jgi:hypothetical protein
MWKAKDLKPHLTRTFKLSRDPHFETTFRDVIGHQDADPRLLSPRHDHAVRRAELPRRKDHFTRRGVSAEVKAWLARGPRFHIHFTPTGSSWLNLIERFFLSVSS